MLILTTSPIPESASKGHLNRFNRFAGINGVPNKQSHRWTTRSHNVCSYKPAFHTIHLITMPVNSSDIAHTDLQRIFGTKTLLDKTYLQEGVYNQCIGVSSYRPLSAFKT